ncbi:THUMP domain-containing protein 1-like [Bolinopsis microptera]|uniref:THUMP domain-containing protein 1-like n=1 Tax=Bolinopsis microptera TaxID=2820187 RepID=UPI00307AACBE
MAEKQKRSKAHYVQNQKRQKTQARGRLGLNDLKSSTKGIIATANFLDYGCRREVFSLLDDFCGKEEKPVCKGNDDEVDEEIAKEIAELKATKKRFQIVNTTLNNMMFIAVNEESIDPCQLVHHILSTLREKKERKTRFTQRVLPVSHTCYASIEDIKKTALLMVKDQLHTKTPKTFGIYFKSRNNSSISRDEVIQNVATVATDDLTFAEFNKVHLDNPEYAIIINIVKTAVFMAVVKDFKLLSKYNIDELTKSYTPVVKEEKAADGEVVSTDNKVNDIVSEEKDDVVSEEKDDVVEKATEVEA